MLLDKAYRVNAFGTKRAQLFGPLTLTATHDGDTRVEEHDGLVDVLGSIQHS
jgi:hypothetical protein